MIRGGRAPHRLRFAMIPLMATVLATAMSSCGTTASHVRILTGSSTGASASVTIERARGIQPTFSKLNGEPISPSRTIRLSPGKHHAQLTIKWPGAGRELVSFPLEIPHAGSYSIEMVTFPDKMSKNYHYDGPTLTSDIAESGVFAGVDPQGAIILLPIFATTMAIDMAGVATNITSTAVQNNATSRLRTIWLRLRADTPNSNVIAWRKFDHPALRETSSAGGG